MEETNNRMNEENRMEEGTINASLFDDMFKKEETMSDPKPVLKDTFLEEEKPVLKDTFLEPENTINSNILNLQSQLPPITIADGNEEVNSSNSSYELEDEAEPLEETTVITPIAEEKEEFVDPVFEKWKKERERKKQEEERKQLEEAQKVESAQEDIPDPAQEIVENTNITPSFDYSNDGSVQNSMDVQNSTPENTNSQPLEYATIETENKEDIDYFSYDFKNNQPEENSVPNNQPLNFDFYNAIRQSEGGAPMGPREDKIVLDKVLAKKDSRNENEQIITINEETGNEYRKHKNTTKYSLYGFYCFLAIISLVFIIFLIERKSNFELTREEVTLALQSTYQAEVIANAKVQENSNYEWSSSDESVVQVDNEGIIKGLNKGTATITVKSKKSRKEKEIAVTVIDVVINSIRFEKTKLTLEIGDTRLLSPIINEDENIIVSLDWISEDENIVTVDQNGRIEAIGAGTANVAAFDKNGSLGAEVTITVKETEKKKPSNSSSKPSNTNTNSNDNKQVSVSRVTLNKANANLKVGDSITVTATIFPSSATNKTVTWSTSNKDVATVSNGKIKAVGEGSATITVTTKDGNKKASIAIKVEKKNTNSDKEVKLTDISLSSSKLSLKVGEDAKITVSFSPSNATNKNITWENNIKNGAIEITSSGDNSIIVKAKSAGSATITAISEDGKHKSTCTITVTSPNTNSNTNTNTNSNSNTNTNSNSNENPEPKPEPKPDPEPVEE